MTSTALETTQGNALALDPQQTDWNPAQRAALAQLGVDRATDGDLQVFHHVCQRTGLDPFARQIYMIERKGKQTIQTGIDGYRLVARRAVDHSREKLSIGAPEWCDWDGKWHEVWIAEGPPAAARVTVSRNGEPFPAIALWREYVQTFWKNGQEQVTQMWLSRPAGQLAKCAEALALRKAFPQDLSGIYVDAELDRADVIQGEVVETRQGGLGAALAEQSSGAEDAPDAPSPESPVERSDSSAPESVTSAQLKLIGVLMGKKGLNITDRAEALAYVSRIVARPIESRNELSKSEAGTLIDSLEADVRILQSEPVDAEIVEDQS